MLTFCEQELILGKILVTKLGLDCCQLKLWLMFITEAAEGQARQAYKRLSRVSQLTAFKGRRLTPFPGAPEACSLEKAVAA